MNIKNLKLGPKLLSAFLILGIVPLLIVGWQAYSKAEKGLTHEVEQKLMAIRDLKGDEVRHYFEGVVDELHFMNSADETHELYDSLVAFHQREKVGAHESYPVDHEDFHRIWNEQGDILRSLQEEFHYSDVYMICAKHGHIMYTNEKNSDVGQNLMSGPLSNSHLKSLWEEVIRRKDVFAADFDQYAPLKGEPAAFIGYPILEDGEVEGVVVVQISIELINEMMGDTVGLGETGETYLLGSDFLMRSDSREDKTHRTVLASFANPKEGSVKTEAAKKAIESGESGVDVIMHYDGNQVISAYKPLEILGMEWAVLAEIDKAEALVEVDGLFKSVLIILIISIVAIVGIALLIARSIAKPIGDMANLATAVADGDLTQEVKVTSGDEVGMLGGALDKMTKNLSNLIGSIKGGVSTVSSASEELSSVSVQMLNGSNEMQNQATALASTTEQMSTNINTMASASEEMSVNANNVASAAEQMSTNMGAVSSAVEQITVSIDQVAQNARSARDVSNKATSSAETATETMTKLGEAAKEIGNVTEVIKRIAEQTNLLALNATIEAAGAGEAGKGFAVVANEIKELANQSANAADDIAHRIEGVQNNTSNAVEVIDEVSEVIGHISEAVETITTAVEEQSKAANEISGNVSQASMGAQNIAASIAEVAKGAQDVSRNAGEAATGATDVSRSIVDVESIAKETNNGAGQITNSASEMARMASELQEQVSQFKL